MDMLEIRFCCAIVCEREKNTTSLHLERSDEALGNKIWAEMQKPDRRTDRLAGLSERWREWWSDSNTDGFLFFWGREKGKTTGAVRYQCWNPLSCWCFQGLQNKSRWLMRETSPQLFVRHVHMFPLNLKKGEGCQLQWAAQPAVRWTSSWRPDVSHLQTSAPLHPDYREAQWRPQETNDLNHVWARCAAFRPGLSHRRPSVWKVHRKGWKSSLTLFWKVMNAIGCVWVCDLSVALG